ncbi:MAG: aminopeptidase [Bacilli bacterium]|nr:aminopeptidase [Bacilli bacterium]
MIKDFEKLKRNYARLIVRRGLNIPSGRLIKIVADIDQPDFVNTLVEECYLAGARHVVVHWNYCPVERLIAERTSLEELKIIPPYKKEEIQFDIKNNVAFIYLESNNPDYLNGVDARKTSIPNMIRRAYVNKVRGDTSYRAPYTIACLPSVEWAKLLFPKLSAEAGVEKFWQLIFKFTYVTANDAVKGWDKHCKDIDDKAKWLNSLHIKALHYQSKNGTDLMVGMTDKYQFAGTYDFDIIRKRKYYSNIPTEECFVSPHRLLTEGTVVASKPLCENGQLIEGIKLKFKKGRIVEAHAKKNEKLLKQLINAEENMHYLGEAALVPFSSMINKSNIIFFNTLLDENACCHFAFGDSYRYTYRGYELMDRESLLRKGLNQATNHVDFMIGTSDLKITAITKDNKKVVIFKNGEWAK